MSYLYRCRRSGRGLLVPDVLSLTTLGHLVVKLAKKPHKPKGVWSAAALQATKSDTVDSGFVSLVAMARNCMKELRRHFWLCNLISRFRRFYLHGLVAMSTSYSIPTTTIFLPRWTPQVFACLPEGILLGSEFDVPSSVQKPESGAG